MKGFLMLLLLALAIWVGWKKWPEIVNNRPGHDLVVVNETGQGLERIRVRIDGQTLVRESLPDGQSVTFQFKVQSEASFDLEAEWANKPGLIRWQGGLVPPGPMLQRHIIRFDPDGEIIYLTENK